MRQPTRGVFRAALALVAPLLLGCSEHGALVTPQAVDAVLAPSPAIPHVGPVPSPQQAAWHEMEMLLFVHFGINTFTGREWGEGTEDPALFHPSDFDAREVVRVAKAAGFEGLILTAKHHEGFALWPTAWSDFSVARSAWRGGRGDVVAAFAAACREAGLAFGVYLSPWDRHEPSYGTPAYDDFYVGQLTELLAGYGPIFEVWLDGANGGDHVPPYDLARYYRTVRSLQPDALIAVAGPDVRWVGNERAVAPSTHWSTVDGRWYPSECDVSIRPGWFWRAEEDALVMSVPELVDRYLTSVGRNCTLLLNVPLDARGRLPEPDARRLTAFRAALDELFADDLTASRPAAASDVRTGAAGWAPSRALDGGADTFWATNDGVEKAWLEVDLGRAVPFSLVELAEPIRYGQRVEAFHVDVWNGARWRTVARGTTIGYKRLLRLEPVRARRVRLVIEAARGSVAIARFGLYR